MLTLIVSLLAVVPIVTPTPARWQSATVTGSIDGVTATHTLEVYLPSGYSAEARHPLLLALHGWGHSATMLRDKGELAGWADRYGIVLALPDMGKTIYETSLYPETKPAKAWSSVPGTRWVGEVILPYMRKHFAVYGDRAHTGAIGYSTGGRGAILLAEAYPELAFAGSASGTYDLMRLAPRTGEYRIHAVVFGERTKFPERWRRDDIITPERLTKLAGVRLYVAHGDADKAVPVDQVAALREALVGSDVVARYEIVAGGKHDWTFWNSQWGPMFAAAAETFGITLGTP